MNNDVNVFVLMGGIFNDVRKYLDGVFKEFGLSRPEWLTLALLRTYPDNLSQVAAKAYVGIETSYFTKVLNKLEELGYIDRRIDPTDRRNRILSVPKKKPAELKKIFSVLEQYTSEMQNALSDKEMQSLVAALAKLKQKIPTITVK